jgi:hypothetical protein
MGTTIPADNDPNATSQDPTSSPPTNDELADLRRKNDLLTRALASTNDVIKRRDSEIEELRKPAAPTRSKDESKNAFFDDPVNETTRIVNDALERQISPFRSFIERQEKNEQLETFIRNAKTNQYFSTKWNAGIEQYCRDNYHQLNPVNEASFNAMVLSAFGLQGLGVIPGGAPTVNPNDRRSNIDPPIVPTDRGRPTLPQNGKRYRDLTEDEAKLCRELKMTKEDYLDMLEISPDEVHKTTIGKPPTQGGK